MIKIANVNEDAIALNKLIDKRIQKQFSNVKFLQHIPAKVISVDNITNKATVRFPTDTVTDIVLKNVSGQPLNVNDTVLVEYKNGSNYSTGYISANLTNAKISNNNKNILYNWDFRNPVNQRGLTSYNGAANYTIDGWYATSSNITLVVASKHITLTSTTTTSHIRYINEGVMPSGTYTISLETEGVGATKAIVGVFKIVGGVTTQVSSVTAPTTAKQIITFTFTLTEDTDANGLQIRLYVDTATGTVKLFRIKLESGSASTLANDPPAIFSEQLLLCQRYLINISNEAWIRAVDVPSANLIRFALPMPNTLRATPTIVVGTDLSVRTIANVAQTGFTFAALFRTGFIQINATKTAHGLTDASLHLQNVVFSAEL